MKPCLALALALPLVLSACGDKSDTATGEATTVEEICATVFECFETDWGWPSEADCQASWLQDCTDSDAYLGCMSACVAGDCAGFALEDGTGGCEPDCWSAHCL